MPKEESLYEVDVKLLAKAIDAPSNLEGQELLDYFIGKEMDRTLPQARHEHNVDKVYIKYYSEDSFAMIYDLAEKKASESGRPNPIARQPDGYKGVRIHPKKHGAIVGVKVSKTFK